MYKTGLFWFTNDLRLNDNAALHAAAQQCETLVCVYIIDSRLFASNRYGLLPMGSHRWRFLFDSLRDLEQQLQSAGQRLHIIYDQPVDAISRIITQLQVDAIFRSVNAGHYEQQHWLTLQQSYRALAFKQKHTHTLLSEADLPFALDELPDTFSKFRKMIESRGNHFGHESSQINLTASLTTPEIPRAPERANKRSNHSALLSIASFCCDELKTMMPFKALFNKDELSDAPVSALELKKVGHNFTDDAFKGGERQASKQIDIYLTKGLASSYKLVRNALDGWQNSTKLSPWLAHGCLSPRQVFIKLDEYEREVEKNESTYWIRFELLWREYFQWYAHLYKAKLFAFSGIQNKKPLTSFYPERFQKWCSGNTPYPLVNACISQLNTTGYMSNRGRQIVASCFVNELGLDWRYGAAYFEQQLLDYDVATNWGNWQYLAGVGADPRGQRHFNLDKQTTIYDPDGVFVNKWRDKTAGMFSESLDSIDAADWPITTAQAREGNRMGSSD